VSFFEALISLSVIDVALIGSASVFFSSLGAYAGLLHRRSILWCAIGALLLLGGTYHHEIHYQWITLLNGDFR
jgi:hypothetical protein